MKNGARAKTDVGKYIGESSRTLAERSREHISGAGNLEFENFIVKHWVTCHSNCICAPNMRFKVLKTIQDPLSRMASEAVMIERDSNMNSRSEYRNNKLSRIVVKNPRRPTEDSESKEDALERALTEKIEALRSLKGVSEKKRGGKTKSECDARATNLKIVKHE